MGFKAELFNAHLFFYFSAMQKQIVFSLLMVLLFCSNGFAKEQEIEDVMRMNPDTNKLNAWIDLSNQYLKTNYELAKNCADSAIVLATNLKLYNKRATAYDLKGKASMFKSDYKEAEEAFVHAIEYYRSTEQDLKEAKVLNSLATAKRDQGHFDESMVALFESLEIQERHKDTSGVAGVFLNIAIVYAIQTDYVKAEEYFLKSLELYEQLNATERINSVMLNLGGMQLESGDYDKAIKTVLAALEKIKISGPPTELARSYYILGNAYLTSDELVLAEENYLIAMNIFDSLGSVMRSTGCLLRLSSVLEKRGDYNKAIAYALTCLERNKEYGILNMTQRSLFQLTHLYEIKGDYKNALIYRKEMDVVKDSLNNLENNKQIAELEEKYQSEVKERELIETRADLEVQELRVKRQQVQQRILIGVVFGGLIVLLLLAYQFSTKKKNNQVLKEKNKIIEEQLSEKEVLLKEIHHRVKNNLQFISSMFNLQARHLKNQEALEVLMEGKNRIHSMALVHQKLYQENNLKGVNMRDYLTNLTESLQHSYKSSLDHVKVTTEIDEVILDIDSAMPIGLIVNEIVTNSFKYAFKNRESGAVTVSLKEVGNHIELVVKDNGIGLKEDVDPKSSEKFGFKLIASLAEKLGATPQISGNEGVSVKLTITNYKKA